MSCPGWDEKSWDDVQHAAAAAGRLVDQLHALMAEEDPDATRLADCFEKLEHTAAFGTMAAAWCEA